MRWYPISRAKPCFGTHVNPRSTQQCDWLGDLRGIPSRLVRWHGPAQVFGTRVQQPPPLYGHTVHKSLSTSDIHPPPTRWSHYPISSPPPLLPSLTRKTRVACSRTDGYRRHRRPLFRLREFAWPDATQIIILLNARLLIAVSRARIAKVECTVGRTRSPHRRACAYVYALESWSWSVMLLVLFIYLFISLTLDAFISRCYG